MYIVAFDKHMYTQSFIYIYIYKLRVYIVAFDKHMYTQHLYIYIYIYTILYMYVTQYMLAKVNQPGCDRSHSKTPLLYITWDISMDH